MPSHQDRVKANNETPHPAVEAKIDALLADLRGTIYLDGVDIWKLRQVARALVRKGWSKLDTPAPEPPKVEPPDPLGQIFFCAACKSHHDSYTTCPAEYPSDLERELKG